MLTARLIDANHLSAVDENELSFHRLLDGNFDAPDRLFSSVAASWLLSTRTTTSVKELVPEFFFRPDIFVNWENLDLGIRHDNTPVDSVNLPP